MQRNDRQMISAMIDKRDIATLILWYYEQGMAVDNLSALLRDSVSGMVQQLVDEQGIYNVPTVEGAEMVIEGRKDLRSLSSMYEIIKQNRKGA